jgi:excisionase family DNA binding protein
MNNTGITEDQILKIAIRRIFQDDFAELKQEIQRLREEIVRLSSLTNQNELLTMDELCAELKLSKPSVYKLIREKKKIKPVQLLDQDFRFRRADVNRLIENSYKEIDEHLNT